MFESDTYFSQIINNFQETHYIKLNNLSSFYQLLTELVAKEYS